MNKVLSVSVTEKGRAMAQSLPYEHVHGQVGPTLRQRWGDFDGFVLMLSVGAAVRIIAPLLSAKQTDPAVVCVDEGGHFAIAVTGGHHGANQLAQEVAGILGAQAVITTATDAVDMEALDALPGFVAEGDIARVTTALLDGRPVGVRNDRAWPLPPMLEAAAASAGGTEDIGVTEITGDNVITVEITDEERAPGTQTVLLRPPSLVVGIGTSTEPPHQELAELVRSALDQAGLSPASVMRVATIDRRTTEAALRQFGHPVIGFTPDELAGVEVPNPSVAVTEAVGTPSVAEAAALLGAGPDAELVAAKIKSEHATVAVARRRRPLGRLSLVGLGPGDPALRTPAATAAVRHAETVVGYSPYVDQCADLLGPHQVVARSPIGAEIERAGFAVGMARQGRRVALVCSGDPGVYAMASLTLELAGASGKIPGPGQDYELEVIPGITAALSAASILGAPLGHDHVYVSLSDLLTPWEVIQGRIEAAASADLVLALYNPRSKGRDWQLREAMSIMAAHRDPQTPVGIVTDVGRPGQHCVVTTVVDFDAEPVGMTTCVIVGSSTTRIVGGRMVTPRGYDHAGPKGDIVAPKRLPAQSGYPERPSR